MKKLDTAYAMMMESLRALRSRSVGIQAPEDKFIRIICENHGYGSVIDSAARQWFLKDPLGCVVPGWCASSIELMRKTDKTVKIVKAARRFAKAWAQWSVTPAMLPDEETVDAAGALMRALGVKQPEVD